jgi:hypothetical protein
MREVVALESEQKLARCGAFCVTLKAGPTAGYPA